VRAENSRGLCGKKILWERKGEGSPPEKIPLRGKGEPREEGVRGKEKEAGQNTLQTGKLAG